MLHAEGIYGGARCSLQMVPGPGSDAIHSPIQQAHLVAPPAS